MFHGGLVPEYVLSLHTNDTPYWSMIKYPSRTDYRPNPVTWELDIHHPAQQPLLMIAVHVLQDKEIVGLLGRLLGDEEFDRKPFVGLYNVDSVELEKVYGKLKNVDFGDLVMLYTVLPGSDALRDVEKLREYNATILVAVAEAVARSRSIVNPWDNPQRARRARRRRSR
jgi:hypothetical protein